MSRIKAVAELKDDLQTSDTSQFVVGHRSGHFVIGGNFRSSKCSFSWPSDAMMMHSTLLLSMYAQIGCGAGPLMEVEFGSHFGAKPSHHNSDKAGRALHRSLGGTLL